MQTLNINLFYNFFWSPFIEKTTGIHVFLLAHFPMPIVPIFPKIVVLLKWVDLTVFKPEV
ncbi:hypothetical protein BFP71_01995 [Roseivirga misakiensis]|uniref:Uncharacterized protein n=1 Tax=Roseivirga misakiensis TaxID=1563681 RepID=A0A1E5T518_9BACT|nr:hypothetical protein BFP71_01995 [Roseivirga misakiensis]